MVDVITVFQTETVAKTDTGERLGNFCSYGGFPLFLDAWVRFDFCISVLFLWGSYMFAQTIVIICLSRSHLYIHEVVLNDAD